MQNQVYYLYITGYLAKTVIDSQVINWIELLDKNDIHFNLLTILTMKAFVKKRKDHIKKLKITRSKISGKIFTVIYTSPRDKTSLGDFMVFLSMLIILFPIIIKKKQIIIQTRTTNFLKPLLWIKKIYRKLGIIYDLRGVFAEEYLLANNEFNIKNVKNEKIKKIYHRKLNEQVKMVTNANTTICVSHKLKEYILNRIDVDVSEKIVVIPGVADAKYFYFDKDERKKIRKNLGIENKIVLIYCGSLDRPWIASELMFHLFKELFNNIPNLYLFCISPDHDIAHELINKFGMNKNNVLCRYVNFFKINKYLSAADIGILLREDMITNNVAAPTKFAEYLLAGLPVIISNNVGDFSEFTKKNNIGLVTNNQINDILTKFPEFFIEKKYDRKDIMKYGYEYFSKQAYLSKMINLYNSVHMSKKYLLNK